MAVALQDLHFVSLGADCQPAHHIRRLSGSKLGTFFDWIYTPPEAISRLIQNDFKDILSPGKIEWEKSGDHISLWDRHYGIQFQHQIKSSDDSVIEELRRDYSFMGMLFRRLLSETHPVCFVRRVHPWDGPDGLATMHTVAQEILAIRPNSIVMTLSQKATHEPDMHGRVIDAFNMDFIESWIGSDQQYDENFRFAAAMFDTQE